MAIVNFTNLDFDQIKASITQYLRSNSNFTDYDFQGSNLSTIIDALAYNSYISAYNANMITNEVFIDSATLRENVVSLAKHIGYLPRSRNCSKAIISFIVNLSSSNISPTYLTLKSGIICTTQVGFTKTNYIFSLRDDIVAPVVNGIAVFNNVEILEGSLVSQSFTVNSILPNQRYILDNANIDTNTIRAVVRKSAESSVTEVFSLCKDFCAIGSESRVFFLQEIEDQRYEIIFGDGVFGRKLEDGNIVELSYIVSDGGEEANNIETFKYVGKIYSNNNRFVDAGISIVSSDGPSQGGRNIESIDSIKKFAPRLYSAQGRAVTSSDYEAIVTQIYPEAESVSVFGGEELDPPQYGKVFITIKPYEGDILPISVKNNIKDSLGKYGVAGIRPEIIDLKYLYVEYDSSVYYDINKVGSVNSLRSNIADSIERYADSVELNKYGARFKYSKFLKIIDDTDASITSNITKITIRRDLKASINALAEYEICYGNSIHVNNCDGYNIRSSGFKVSNYVDTVYITDIPKRGGMGEIILFKLNGGVPVVLRRNYGKVDYKKGEIVLYPTIITSTEKIKFNTSVIEISGSPSSNDVIGLQDLYLQLDTTNSMLNMIRDSISSGEDTSGSSFITSSSYTNSTSGQYIRN